MTSKVKKWKMAPSVPGDKKTFMFVHMHLIYRKFFFRKDLLLLLFIWCKLAKVVFSPNNLCTSATSYLTYCWFQFAKVTQWTKNDNNKSELFLTQWGRVTHLCVSKLTIIGSDNGLSPERRQAIIWTNAGILLIGPSGTNFSEILIEIQTFSLKKIRLKMSSAKWCSLRLGLNVLINPLSMSCVFLIQLSGSVFTARLIYWLWLPTLD